MLPDLDLLDEHDPEGRGTADPAELERVQQTLIETLGAISALRSRPATSQKARRSRATKSIRPKACAWIRSLVSNATWPAPLALNASIFSRRFPGKDTVGIELANTRKVKVTLRELLQSTDWEEAKSRAKIPLALGKDVYGKTIIADLAQMPHLLVAGTTGSGKSVCINALIASMLFRFTPDELRFIMIDPKVVEMQIYNSLPHLAFPVVTDPKKVLLALRWVIDEMEKRYKIFAQVGVRNITSFNGRPQKKTQKELDAEAAEAGVTRPQTSKRPTRPPPHRSKSRATTSSIIPDKMPYIVVIIDELADLMQTAPADVESAIARITQMARAAGIHHHCRHANAAG